MLGNNYPRSLDVSTGMRGGFGSLLVGLWAAFGVYTAGGFNSRMPLVTAVMALLAFASVGFSLYAFFRKITLTASPDALVLAVSFFGIPISRSDIPNPQFPCLRREEGEKKHVEFRITCDNAELCWGGSLNDRGLQIYQDVHSLLQENCKPTLPQRETLQAYRNAPIAASTPNPWPSSHGSLDSLGVAFDFRPNDLILNRRGQLSPQQKARLTSLQSEAWSLCAFRWGPCLLIGIPILIVSSSILPKANSSNVFAATIVGALISLLGLGGSLQSSLTIWKLWKDLNKSGVVTTQGLVQKKLTGESLGGYQLQLNGLSFAAPGEGAFALLDDQTVYRLYFTPNHKQLLAVEPV